MSSPPDYGQWTLSRYFREVYTVAKQDEGRPLRGSTVANYRQTIAKFDRAFGRQLTLREITPEILAEFREITAADGVKPETAKARSKVILYLIRHWQPGRVPPKADPLAGELRELFETHYRPARMRGAAKSSIAQARRAIRGFSEQLGRPSELSDLTDETVGLYAKTASSSALNALLAIWRYASQVDAVETWPGARFKNPTSSAPSRGAILGYLEDVYLPERLADGLAPRTAVDYRAAIVAYDKFLGPSRAAAAPVKVTPHKLAMFQQWQVDIGVSEKKARDRATCVRAVAKHACPERWLPRDPTAPVETLADDALVAVYRSHYLAANPGIKDNTVRQFEQACNRFGKYLGHVPTLDDLTDENLGGWMRAGRAEGLSVSTVNGYRCKVRALWQFCAEKRFVDRFPTVKKIPPAQWIPDAWSQDQLRSLYAACDKMPGMVCDIPAPDWWRALIRVAWSTGERTGALFAVRFDWIDTDGNLEIPAEFRKGGRKAFLYRLTPEALAAIDKIREPKRAMLFPLPTKNGVDWYHRKFRRLLRVAGLPYVSHKSGLQKIRRSFASHVEAAGGNATAALSHSSRDCTERSYLDPRVVGQQPAAELLFDLGGE